MSEEKFAKKLSAIYKAILAERKDSEYVVNQPQMEKFIKLVEFFFELSEEMGGDEPKVSVVPRQTYGDVTTKFVVVAVSGKDCQRLAEVISYCSAFGIDPVDDGEILVSCTVPEVFVPVHLN